jgi:opacity protein-like surface antigen
MLVALRALVVVVLGVLTTLPAGAQLASSGGAQSFFGPSQSWSNALYASIGGQWAHLNGLQLSTDGSCGAQNDAFVVCGAGASLGSSDGGGFRVELGTVVLGVRPYVSFAGNYGWHPSGTLTPQGLFIPNSVSADARAETLIFGVGLDSARLLPNLNLGNANIFVQGGIGVSWNRLSSARIAFPTAAASLDLPTTTTTSFAGEVGAGVEYAFTPALALRAGYNSRWIGSFRSEGTGNINLGNLGGGTVPFAFQPIASDHARVDEVYGALVIRLGALFGR